MASTLKEIYEEISEQLLNDKEPNWDKIWYDEEDIERAELGNL